MNLTPRSGLGTERSEMWSKSQYTSPALALSDWMRERQCMCVCVRVENGFRLRITILMTALIKYNEMVVVISTLMTNENKKMKNKLATEHIINIFIKEIKKPIMVANKNAINPCDFYNVIWSIHLRRNACLFRVLFVCYVWCFLCLPVATYFNCWVIGILILLTCGSVNEGIFFALVFFSVVWFQDGSEAQVFCF